MAWPHSQAPTQVFSACSMEKWGEPGIFSPLSMTSSTCGRTKKQSFAFCSMLGVYDSNPPLYICVVSYH